MSDTLLDDFMQRRGAQQVRTRMVEQVWPDRADNLRVLEEMERRALARANGAPDEDEPLFRWAQRVVYSQRERA